MERQNIFNGPIIGRTYSLYGGKNLSDGFFDNLSLAAGNILNIFGADEASLLEYISCISTSKKRIKKSGANDGKFSSVMNILRENLSGYLLTVQEHLRSLKLSQRWDKRLATNEDQYLLYMLEIELTNRINTEKFLFAGRKIAFLPHCLRDFSRDCLSEPDDIDYLCRRCSKICNINRISVLLKEHKVTPYIWMEADLKKIFSGALKKSESISVLGIACIPELANGMRLCRKYNIPVIGIPLDANRCRRWMGNFYENSVNLGRLTRLLTAENVVP